MLKNILKNKEAMQKAMFDLDSEKTQLEDILSNLGDYYKKKNFNSSIEMESDCEKHTFLNLGELMESQWHKGSVSSFIRDADVHKLREKYHFYDYIPLCYPPFNYKFRIVKCLDCKKTFILIKKCFGANDFSFSIDGSIDDFRSEGIALLGMNGYRDFDLYEKDEYQIVDYSSVRNDLEECSYLTSYEKDNYILQKINECENKRQLLASPSIFKEEIKKINPIFQFDKLHSRLMGDELEKFSPEVLEKFFKEIKEKLSSETTISHDDIDYKCEDHILLNVENWVDGTFKIWDLIPMKGWVRDGGGPGSHDIGHEIDASYHGYTDIINYKYQKLKCAKCGKNFYYIKLVSLMYDRGHGIRKCSKHNDDSATHRNGVMIQIINNEIVVVNNYQIYDFKNVYNEMAAYGLAEEEKYNYLRQRIDECKTKEELFALPDLLLNELTNRIDNCPKLIKKKKRLEDEEKSLKEFARWLR